MQCVYSNTRRTMMFATSKHTMTSFRRASTLLSQRTTTTIKTTLRSISIGTDMISSLFTLEKAHPWYECAADGSNKTIDNVVTLKELFPRGKTIVLFGVPAPFTGTCTHLHYPGYKVLADQILKTGGVDDIICYAVSDPYCMNGWEKSLNNDSNKIKFYTDPNATFAKAYGISKEYPDVSLGLRSIRFSSIIVDGIVKTFRAVSNAETDAQEVLAELIEMKENNIIK